MKQVLITLCILLLFGCTERSNDTSSKSATTPDVKKETLTEFNVWAAADPYVTVDTIHGVQPLQSALRQSEGYWFWRNWNRRQQSGFRF